jgi:uncharacterized protein
MAGHPNVVRVTDLYAAFDKGDFAVLNGGFAEDLVWHEGERNQLTGDHRGREAVFSLFGKLTELTEDLSTLRFI